MNNDNNNTKYFRMFDCPFEFSMGSLPIQCEPLNMITLGLRETDNINQMMTIIFLNIVSCCNVKQMGSRQSDHKKAADNINSDHIKRLPLYYYLRTLEDSNAFLSHLNNNQQVGHK